MATKFASVSEMKKGSYIVLEGVPCRIMDTATSRPGKHGHAKVRMVAVGIFDEKKRDVVMPGHDNVEVPIVEKKNAQVLSINGSTANLMDSETYETFDLPIPEELKDSCKENSYVLYWDVMGSKVMKQIKSD